MYIYTYTSVHRQRKEKKTGKKTYLHKNSLQPNNQTNKIHLMSRCISDHNWICNRTVQLLTSVSFCPHQNSLITPAFFGTSCIHIHIHIWLHVLYSYLCILVMFLPLSLQTTTAILHACLFFVIFSLLFFALCATPLTCSCSTIISQFGIN